MHPLVRILFVDSGLEILALGLAFIALLSIGLAIRGWKNDKHSGLESRKVLIRSLRWLLPLAALVVWTVRLAPLTYVRWQAGRGHAASQMELASWYFSGERYFRKNRDQALVWGRRAAERGLVQSQFAMALVLEDHGTDVEKAEARAWARRAGEGGEYRGYLLLAMWEGDRERSRMWGRKAIPGMRAKALTGDGKACYRLGRLMLEGDLLPLDRARGLALLLVAVRMGVDPLTQADVRGAMETAQPAERKAVDERVKDLEGLFKEISP